MSSLDSGLPNTETLPPFDIDLKKAYQHIKQENTQLLEDIKQITLESEKFKSTSEEFSKERKCLKEDVNMLKNLVYRLNVELETFQDIRSKTKSNETSKKYLYELPSYYQKNFLKPILPLLKAYSETIVEKNEVFEQLEINFEKFQGSFNEILKENETLYKELERKLADGGESNGEKVLRLNEELKICQEEKDLFKSQSKLECEKSKEVQNVLQTKSELSVTFYLQYHSTYIVTNQMVRGRVVN